MSRMRSCGRWSRTRRSPSNPFVFCHQRKAGGTDLRKSLLDYAVAEGLPHYIPCYEELPCDINNIRTAPGG